MKIRSFKSTGANTLIIVMVYCGVLGILLASYLTLVNNQNVSTARSSTWNHAISVAEAGVEEALTQVQYSITNLNTNGWTYTNNSYRRTRTLDSASYYTVSIQATNRPVITSTGYVLAPLKSSTYISRTVRVTTTNNAIYGFAMLVRQTIDVSGASVIDSFDSLNPSYSTGGQYDSTKAKASAIMATVANGAGKLAMGTGKLYGYANTGGGAGTVTVGSSGSIGDAAFVNNPANGGKIQSGHTNYNFTTAIPDVVAPFTSGQTLFSGTVGGTNYAYVANGGNYYYYGDFNMGGSSRMLVSGNNTVYVVGDFTCSALIYMAPGANLTLYVGGGLGTSHGKVTISGGGIANTPGNAANLTIKGLPAVNTFTYSGSSKWMGVLYAPGTDVTMSGSAFGVGAVVANSATLSGGMNFHYDEGLGNGLQYTIKSWTEL